MQTEEKDQGGTADRDLSAEHAHEKSKKVAAELLRAAAIASGLDTDTVDAALKQLSGKRERPKRDVKRNFKDSVFVDLFSRPRYRRELCVALGHGAGLPEEAFREVTLRNTLVNGLHNDIGIEIGDVLIVLAEEQSEWSENIVLRIFGYLYYTWIEKIERTPGVDIFDTKAVKLAKPKCYVFFPGPRGNKPDVLRLSEVYFKGEDVDVELVVHCIYDGQPGDIIDQYFRFAREADRIIHKKGPTQEAVQGVVEWCMENDVLRDYMEERGSEVARIMQVIFNEERDQAQWGQARYDAGVIAGRTAGEEKGAISALIKVGRMRRKPHELIIEEIIDAMHVDASEAERLYEKYDPDRNKDESAVS